MKFEASVVIERPIDEVWKFVTDLPSVPKWSHALLEKRQTSPGPLGVGTTVQSRTKDRTFTGRVTEFEPNRKFTWEMTSGPIRGSHEYDSLETVEGGTRLTHAVDFRLSGLYKLLGPFIAGRTRRNGEAHAKTDLDNVKRILESEAQTVPIH
ncbi:MAG TPA: SRPBCC family protein [Nitrososphaerales archaeon]|nr:SRPBCC family protein [Nitrososphaerales archaeon]